MKRDEYIHNQLRLGAVTFQSNPYKDQIRLNIATRLGALVKEKKRRLHYFGMPSAKFYDLEVFKEFLDKVTSAENNEVIYQEQVKQMQRFNLEFCNVLYGDVDQIVAAEQDIHSKAIRWPFDFIFLDYYDGLCVNNADRLLTINKCISKQSECGVDTWLFALCHKYEQREQASVEELLEYHEGVINQLIFYSNHNNYYANHVCTYIYMRTDRRTKERLIYMHYTLHLSLDSSLAGSPIEIYLSTESEQFQLLKKADASLVLNPSYIARGGIQSVF